jgi:UDP-N-acetyl-D-glucosamine dehydrogenase
LELVKKITSREARIGIIGLGYVGLPLVIRYCEEGFYVTGFDIDIRKVEKLNAGESYIKHIAPDRIREIKSKGLFEATTDCSQLTTMDCET